VIRDWIRQGAAWDRASAPKLTAIEVRPERGSVERASVQQLAAFARYSDGSVRDVTEIALYESNDKAMAEVDDRGLVKILDICGNVAVMVRYQGKVTVFRASIPLGAPVANLPPAKNFVDQHVFPISKPWNSTLTALRRLDLSTSSDPGYWRPLANRGRNEGVSCSKDADKRAKLIDELLHGPDYADYFANKWTALLKIGVMTALTSFPTSRSTPGCATAYSPTSATISSFASCWRPRGP